MVEQGVAQTQRLRQDRRASAFLSYSRQDAAFAKRLSDGLEALGYVVWIDVEDIRKGERWREAVLANVRAADAFIFVISPRSADSDMCRREAEHAREHRKKIIPVVHEHVVDRAALPEVIAETQEIDASSGADWDRVLTEVSKALDSDLQWGKAHRRLTERAYEWNEQERDRSFLLKGSDLEDAESWLARGRDHPEQPPTRLQAAYITASRRAAVRTTRVVRAAVGVALAVATGLAIFGLLQRGSALSARDVAVSRALAVAANSRLSVDPELSVVLAREALAKSKTAQAQFALRKGLLATPIQRSWKARPGTPVVSADGALIAVASSDPAGLTLWSAHGGRRLRAAVVPTEQALTGPSFSPDGSQVAVAGTGDVYVWDVRSWHRRSVTAPGAVASFEVDSSHDRIWYLTPLNRLRAVSLGSGKEVGLGPAARQPLWRAIGAGGRVALHVVKGASRVEVVDPRRPQGSIQLRGLTDTQFASNLSTARFSPDGSRVAIAATSSATPRVRVWNARTGAVVSTVPGTVVGFGGARRILILDADAGAVRVLDAGSGRTLHVATGIHTSDSIAGSPSGGTAVVAPADGIMREYSLVARTTIARYRPLAGGAATTTVGPTGLTAATVGTTGVQGEIVLWDVRSGSLLRRFEQSSAEEPAQFDPRNRFLLSNGPSRTPVWNLRTGKAEGTARDSLTLSPAEPRGVELPFDAPVRLVRSPGWRRVRELPHSNSTTGAAFSVDGRRLALSTYGRVTVYNWPFDERGPSFPVGNLKQRSLSRDGRLLALLRGDVVSVWDVPGHRLVRTIRPPAGVVDAEFSPRGEVIATSGSGRVDLWDARSGELLTTFRAPGSGTTVAFSPSGHLVLATATEGWVRIFSCEVCGSLAEVESLSRARIPRQLSAAERASFGAG